MNSITVYCSASEGLDSGFNDAAETVGRLLAENGIELVYGGGAVGLMGVTAKACKAAGGKVTGIITEHLMASEQGWDGCDELIIVDSMRQRKRQLVELAEGFMVLPGGLGTYEEFFETLVGRLLEEHQKPIGILNDRGHFDPMMAMLQDGIDKRFITEPTMELVHVDDDAASLLKRLIESTPVEIDPDRFYPARSGE
jgi:uncharacterized protein (TIGR00730 family)